MRFLFCLTIFLGSVAGLAQTSGLNFNELKADLGELNETDGPVDYDFKFVNNYEDSIQLKTVVSSCGCTLVDWSKEWIQPGDSGVIIARYNPINRPGSFNKSIRVIDSRENFYNLYVSGQVLTRSKGITYDFPVIMGQLRLQTRAFNMGHFTTEKSVSKNFTIHNSSESPMIFSGYTDTLSHFSLQFNPDSLSGRTEGEVKVTFDPGLLGDLGYFSETITLLTNDSLQPEKRILLTGTITEFFPKMTKSELEAAPRLAFDNTTIDFGYVSSGEIANEEIQLINQGKNPLEIRKVVANCDCMVVDLTSKKIEPSDYAILKVAFDPGGRRGRQYKTITVFSNDPTAPTQVISVKAQIR